MNTTVTAYDVEGDVVAEREIDDPNEGAATLVDVFEDARARGLRPRDLTLRIAGEDANGRPTEVVLGRDVTPVAA